MRRTVEMLLLGQMLLLGVLTACVPPREPVADLEPPADVAEPSDAEASDAEPPDAEPPDQAGAKDAVADWDFFSAPKDSLPAKDVAKDGAEPDVGGNADAKADAVKPDAACACAPATCGTQVCGHSACGYDCGTCGAGAWCSSGQACIPGVPPGKACQDAWGASFYQPSKGYAACPGQPGLVRSCTCTGSGAWINCGPCVPTCP